MRFSVIIPTYNRVEFLKEALDSVWRQTFTDYEVIVVDDGSSDGTWEYLSSFGKRITALRQENAGPGAARNLGVKHAKGDYFAFLDSDDLWLSWTLETFASVLLKCQNPSLVVGNVMEFKDHKELFQIERVNQEWEEYPDYLATSHRGYLPGSGMTLFSRNAYLKISGFSERIKVGEDHDFALRIGDEPGFVKVVRPVTLCYLRHGNGVTSDVSELVKGIKYLISNEKYGFYPGGLSRRKERCRILTRAARPVILECLKRNCLFDGWKLYFRTLIWNMMDFRWKFVIGFPLVAMRASLCKRESIIRRNLV